MIQTSEYSHSADSIRSEVNIALSKMRDLAASFNSPPRRVIRSVTSDISKNAAVEMGSYQALSLCRVRNKANTTPKQPESLAELLVSDRYAETKLKEINFLLFDNMDFQNRIVIFATPGNLNFLRLCESWYMDGTFDITPPLFKQVYTIHGDYERFSSN